MTIINEADFPLLPSQAKKKRPAIGRRTESQTFHNNNGVRISFNDLPDELILEILEHLSAIDRFESSWLPKLALTSRRLYRIVIGRLYERYDNSRRQPYLFLRSLASNPWIAERVRDVHICVASGKFSGMYVPTANDKKVIKNALRAINMPSWKPWATKCNEDFRDHLALRSTMLLFTPNVTSITHKEYNTEKNAPKPVWVDMISKAAVGAFGSIHRFQYLQSVTVDAVSSVLGEFAPLFRMQSLRKIHLLAVAESGDFIPGRGNISTFDRHSRELQRLIPPARNNLEELILERCFYSELCLDLMIASSRRLKTFKYIAELEDNRWDIFDKWGGKKLPRDRSKTMVKILRRHEGSLERLHVFGGYNLEGKAWDRIHLYEDMKAFTSLKEISCPLGMITSREDEVFADRLPSSLVTFRMPIRPWSKEDERFGALKHLLKNCATYTPHLQEVRVRGSGGKLFKREYFIRLSTKAGIKFLNEPGDWKYYTASDYHSEDDSDFSFYL